MSKIPDDIEKLDQRIRDIKQQHSQTQSRGVSTGKNVSRALRIGTEFVAAVFVSLAIGVFLDKIFGTKVLFLLVFSVFGCIAGMLNVYRSAKEMDESIQKEND